MARAMSAVASAIGTSRLPWASLRVIEPVSTTACRAAARGEEPDLMAALGEVGCGGIAAVAATENRNVHGGLS